MDNLYFAVNRRKAGCAHKKAKKEDVEAALCLHVDVDDPTALERITAYRPKPTAVVFSGGGYQAFWLLEDETTELARVERINKALAEALGGDNCHNVDRIMRLHRKRAQQEEARRRPRSRQGLRGRGSDGLVAPLSP